MRALALSASMALAACGPVIYIRDARTADADVEAAREAQAEKLAPYWFTLAVEYLAKAREEAGHSDFQTAARLGRRASVAARKAVERSLSASRRGEEGPR